MPKLSAHVSATTTKLLLIGDSGAGKTGALASLAGAGYNIRVVDLDNGLDVLKNLLSDPKSPYGADALSRVDYETITDKMRIAPGGVKLIPAKATVWQRAISLIDNWKTETADYGPLHTWTPNDVLVIDSLTRLSQGALDWVLMSNNKLGSSQFDQSYWYAAQNMVESLMQMLYDENVKCNVIVNSHIVYIGPENLERGYPSSVGKALSPKLPRYFNTTLLVKSNGTKREIVTEPTGVIEVKNTAPLRVSKRYPLETGLADYFRDVRGA